MFSRRGFIAGSVASVAAPSILQAQIVPEPLPAGFAWEVQAEHETFWVTQALIDKHWSKIKDGTFPWRRFSIAPAPGLAGSSALRSHVDGPGEVRVSLDHLSPAVPIDPARFPAAFMLEVDHWIEANPGTAGKEWALQLGRGYIGDGFFKTNQTTYGRDGTVLNLMRIRSPDPKMGDDNRYGCYATDLRGASSSQAAVDYFAAAGVNVTNGSHYFGNEWKTNKSYVSRPVQEWLKVQAYVIPSPQAGESTFTVRYIRADGQIVVSTRANRVNPFFYGPQQCLAFFAHLRDMDGGKPRANPTRWACGSYMRNARLLTGYRL